MMQVENTRYQTIQATPLLLNSKGTNRKLHARKAIILNPQWNPSLMNIKFTNLGNDRV